MRSKRELPPLLVRADASVSQGTGHVMRCLALAEAWRRRGGRAHFVTCQPSAQWLQRLDAAGVRHFEVDSPWPGLDDRDVTRSQIEHLARSQNDLPWLVIDGYHFDASYLEAMRSAPCRIMLVDDYAGWSDYDCDIVLNLGIHAPRLKYPAARNTWQLLGTSYALLRGEFEDWRRFTRPPVNRATNVLVTLGGADCDNVTAKVVAALQSFTSAEVAARVIVGPLHPGLAELQRRVAVHGNIHLQTNLSELAPLMAWADVAIAAGGTTAWELAFMQTPALLLVLAENQAAVAAGIDSFGAAQSLGRAENHSPETIADALRQLLGDRVRRERMARRGKVMVDGRGSERVLAAMAERENFLAGDNLSVRAATADDSLLLWQWANDPATRENSFHSAPISFDDHEVWFAAKMHSSDCRIWIVQIGALPAGQIRYERIDPATAQISFNVAPGFRGLRLGSELLSATAELAAQELNVRQLEAVTFADNQASRRAFVKAGFELVEQRVIDGRQCAIFHRAVGKKLGSEFFAAIH